MKFFRSLYKAALLSVFILTATRAVCDTSDVEAAHALAQRLMAEKANSIIFNKVSSATDTFSMYSKGGKIIIEGNSANSMAVALNYYLRNYCLTSVSWRACDSITIPASLPRVKKKISAKARVGMRFFLNYCTFGYSMPWWKKCDWERFIDWMALNGVNMPLAITGQESVWFNVWRKFGLTDEEILAFFTGPAFLPWHRMCNIDGWMGPLPMSWIKNQEELQKFIVKRERELGMKPILPAFAGHVPDALKRYHPDIKTTRVRDWGGFSLKYQCTFLAPSDPMFRDIQKAFLEEQTKLYGTDHFYGADSFNEVDPPSWEEADVSSMTKNIYESMAAADSKARWIQMAWLFYVNKNWKISRVKAMMDVVPKGRMIMLDYYCERDEIWKIRDWFYGQPYIWCYLGNFGGNTLCIAPFKTINENLSYAYAHGRSNLVGVGATLEGLGVNQYAYEYLMDKVWTSPMTDEQWIKSLADSRYGAQNATARVLWKDLCNNAFTMTGGDSQGTFIEMPPAMNVTEHFKNWKVLQMRYFNNFKNAWSGLAFLPDTHRDSYYFDLVNFGRQTLGMLFQQVHGRFSNAYERRDIDSMRFYGNEMKAILCDIDTLLALHPQFSLKQWNEDARAFGVMPMEQDYYEENARMLITRWGEKGLTDYARRGWSGLVSGYYSPRWNKFIDIAIACVEEGKPFDDVTYKKWLTNFTYDFCSPKYKINYINPQNMNAQSYSRKLLKKYFK